MSKNIMNVLPIVLLVMRTEVGLLIEFLKEFIEDTVLFMNKCSFVQGAIANDHL